MRRLTPLLLAVPVLALALKACAPRPPSPATDEPTRSSLVTQTSTPQGKTIVVTSTSDNGLGTLREALRSAQSHDTIIFDLAVFPPDRPTVISLSSELPSLSQGYLAIDASDAGVIIDGSLAGGDWTPGLAIESEWNAVQGLQITNFTGAGIVLYEHASHNVIGGDPHIGSGPLGQGNLIGGSAHGVALFGADNNTIAGNLIGTGILGKSPSPNRYAGIYLADGARANVIGPHNVVAFSGDAGIDVRTFESTGNTITQNSIHHNQAAGIHLLSLDASSPTPPVLLGYDLQAGTVEGVTCPFCVVEVFSSGGDDAQVYEGTAAADRNGGFTLKRGNPLTGPEVTGTARGSDGSTSTFSLPTSGSRGSVLLQKDDELPQTALHALQSSDLEDNRMGTHTEARLIPREMYQEYLVETASLGVTRIRMSLNETEVPFDLSKPELSIDPADDAWISGMVSRGMTVTYVLDFWDKEFQANGGELGCPRFQVEGEIERYLDYVQFTVNRLKDRVSYFEIWNEPNGTPCPQGIEVEDYISLVRRVVPVIRQEAPEARIVVGAVTWLHDPGSQAYLFAILNSDIMPIIDAISWHPFYGASPQYADVAEYYYAYPSLVRRIRDLASASGFEGEYRADELTWRTPLNALADHPWTYSEITAAKYYARAVVMHLGMDVAASTAVDGRQTIIYTTVRNLATLMAGARPIPIPVEVLGVLSNRATYSFSLPNGDELVAIWADGNAVDYDPGTEATLTFPGRSGHKVLAIDVLNGFEQQLISNDESGSLVVPNLPIRDYPIFLRITD